MRRRTKILIVLGLLAALPVMVLTAGLLYLQFGDLSRHRGAVERRVSDILGRELRIAGTFEPSFSLTPSLEASQITLANVPRGREPAMAAVERLSVSVDLWSLVRGPFHIHHLEIEGARVLVETWPDHPVNWSFQALKKDGDGQIKTLHYLIDHAEFNDVEVIIHSSTRERPFEWAVAHFGFSSDLTDSLDVQMESRLNGTALRFEGKTGPLLGLLTARCAQFDFEGLLGDAEFTTSCQLSKYAYLGGTTIDLKLDGPDTAALTEPFGLPSLGGGPIRCDAHVEPSPAGNRIALTADLGDLAAEIDGSLDSLRKPGLLNITVAASGPDLRAAGALTGVQRLPPAPFDVSGGLTWQEFPLIFKEFTLRVGENHLLADGSLGEPPRMTGSDFTFRGEGPDASSLASLFGLELPARPYEVNGRLLRVEKGFRIENVEARIGRTAFEADGFVGDAPGYAGTDLQASIQCPDLSRYSDLAGVDLPAEAFEAAGRLGENGESITLQGCSARLGDNSARIEGKIRLMDEHAELDLQLDIEGPDLSRITWLAGIDGIPAKPYRAAGAVGIHPNGWHLSEVRAESAGMSLEAEGLLIPGPGLLGTELRLRFAGPDSSYPASLAGLDGLPPEPFTVEGTLRVVDGGYALDRVDAEVGIFTALIDGHLGPPPSLLGTELRVDGQGENLSFFEPFLGGTVLPDEPFEVDGSLAVDQAGLRLNPMVVETVRHRASVRGLLATGNKLEGSDVRFEVQGRDLRETGVSLAAAGVEGVPGLPAEAFSISGRMEIDEAGYLLHGVEGHIGTGSLQLDGRVGPFPECRGTDLTLLGDDPDSTLLTSLTGGEIELTPFRMSGRVERSDTDFRFHDFTVRLGEYRTTLSGILGDPPTMAGTDLEFNTAGPGLGLPQQIARLFHRHELDGLPDGPFEVVGQGRGSPEDFTVSGLDARLGDSDISGWFRLDLEEKPRLHGQLTSERIDHASFFKARAVSADSNEITDGEAESGLLFSDKPINLAPLNKIDAEVHWSIRELLIRRALYTNVRIGARVENGGLHVNPISATGPLGGVLGGHFSAEPAGEDCRLRADLALKGGHLDLSKSTEHSDDWVRLDIEADFQGTGRSPHDIAGNSDGYFVVIASEGMVDNTLFESLGSSLLPQILNMLNPLRDKEPATILNCGVIVMSLENGLATIDPLAIQTEKLSLSGKGEIDFDTETFELRWVAKPRKGFGVSASAITDNYVQLGGTLADPQLDVTPLRGAVSTGLTVGTLGLALVGKGLWNRLTAHKKICECALEEAARQRSEWDHRQGDN